MALDEQIRGCLEEFQALTALLDGLCGEQAPHSSNIKNALFHCQEVVSTVAGDRIKQAALPVRGIHGPGMSTNGIVPATYDFQNLGLAEAFDDDSELAEGPPIGPAHGIPSRDHALMMLEAIAAFFRQTEPHSPIPYTLEQTVRWGRMPLPDLLSELIPDQNAREHYFRMVGIPTHAGVELKPGPASRPPPELDHRSDSPLSSVLPWFVRPVPFPRPQHDSARASIPSSVGFASPGSTSPMMWRPKGPSSRRNSRSWSE